MSQQSEGPPLVREAGHSATRRAAGQWELEIRWRFENHAAAPVYVLIARPLKTVVADPLVLDHSSPGTFEGVSLNQDPGFEFLRVEASGTAERQLTYHLALADEAGSLNVVGRFGYGHTPPEPDWERAKNWRRAAAWQSLADSEPFVVKFGD